MIETLLNFDSHIMLMLNSFHTAYFDKVMVLISDKWVWAPFYLSLLLIIHSRYKAKAAITAVIAIIVAVALTDQTCATLIRPWVERMRPSNLDNPLSEFVKTVGDYRGGAYGFPSCHAANTFCLAVFMSLTVRKRLFTLVLLAWAILNSYSRLYLGVHYPGDLLIGAVIGSLFAVLTYYLSQRFAADKKFPMTDAHAIASLSLGVTLALIMLASI